VKKEARDSGLPKSRRTTLLDEKYYIGQGAKPKSSRTTTYKKHMFGLIFFTQFSS
jgi:hypothetical protein